MELDVFARFHAAPGQEERMADVLRVQARAVRLEPGCLYIQPCRSKREPAQFFLFSRWTDEPAFQVHADLDTTHRFISTMEQLSDQPVDVHRSLPVDD
jgi:quinol monooxygenase YgiN